MNRELERLRAALDDVDARLLDALAQRLSLVQDVARVKSAGGTVLRDADREEALLGRLVALGKERGLDPFLVTRIFREVLDHSLRLQHERLASAQDPARCGGVLFVGFQGGEGAFSHMAAVRAFSTREAEVRFQGFPGFRPMLEALRDRELDYVVLPIENTTAGSINESYDLLAEMDLHLVGEEVQRVEHCLIGLEEVPLERIRRIYSHPVALAQCRTFLGSLRDCHAEAYLDTALSVAKVKEDEDLSQAAIASAEAARVHGLPILRRGVQDHKENFTRMVVVGREPETFDARIPCKTSVIFATRHEKGALARGLALLAADGMNLTKLESRPRPNTPWEYRFYLDFEGNIAKPEVRDALERFAAETSYLRVLGSYPARTVEGARPAEPRLTPKRPTPIPPAPAEAALRIRVGSMTLGPTPLLAAGPKSAENAAVLRGAAKEALGVGARLLYGGYLDVRQPVDGQEPAALLAEGARARGLPLALRVDHPEDVARVARHADLLVVASEHGHDTALLRELGQTDRPLMLTRSPHASRDEWLASARFVVQHGNRRVLLLDAGVFGLERSRSLDLAALPLVRDGGFLGFVDLAATTEAGLMAAAALAAGACGLIAPLGSHAALAAEALAG